MGKKLYGLVQCFAKWHMYCESSCMPAFMDYIPPSGFLWGTQLGSVDLFILYNSVALFNFP